jgi:hypothetical protein
VVGSKTASRGRFVWESSEFKTLITHEGYRELPSAAEMRKLLNRKIVEQNGICPICDESLQTTEMLFRITNDAKGWEERGDDHPDLGRACE